MEQVQHLSAFFRAVEHDARIAPVHISIYAALLHFYLMNGSQDPISAYSYEIMRIAKISTRSTYFKGMRELNEYGYLRFRSTRKRTQASKIFLLSITD